MDKVEMQVRYNRIWEIVYSVAFNEQPTRPDLAFRRANDAVAQLQKLAKENK